MKMKHKKVTNNYFIKLRDVITTNIKHNSDIDVISTMKSASMDDSDKSNIKYLYDGSTIDMDIIKLDDLTKYRKCFLQLQGNCDPLSGVDAICIDNRNEWFFIEFKNCNINDSKVKKSIRKKMLESIWYVFFMYSIAGEDIKSLFDGDITKFSRENINYIIVGSYSKNLLYSANIQAKEKIGKHYTPPGFDQYRGYYFKDVYMVTEIELRNFIMKFDV